MRPKTLKAISIISRLGAATDGQVAEEITSTGLRVEVALPLDMTRADTDLLLAALADADDYGHSSNEAGQQHVWATIQDWERP